MTDHVTTRSDALSTKQSVTAPDVPRIQRRTLVVLIISQIFGTIGVGVAPSIGILLAGEVTDSEAWAGLARVAGILGTATMGIPLGNLATRHGRRVALTTGWTIAGLGGLILIAAAQWGLTVPLFVGLFLFGAGSAVTLQARFAATDLAAPVNKARSLSLVVWMATIGMVLGPNLGVPGEAVSQLTGLTVYASAFLIAVAFSVIAALVVLFFLRPDPMLLSDELTATKNPAPLKKSGAIRSIVNEMRDNRPARVAIIAIVVGQVVMVSIMTMTPVHVMHEGGSLSLVGITISLHILGMYALAPVVGLLTDRFGNRLTMTLGGFIFLLSLLIGICWAGDMTWVVISLILLGVGWSFVNVSASALFATAVSSETRASSQGGVDSLANLFGALAAFASGPLMAVTSFSALSIVGVVALIPLAVVLSRPMR
ncbi:MFS transporter [Actinomycetaceae bacterium MB13-C1-2]|nr:MFS transporter [Actinomycetaceae bacterium MB13-C1-2]